MANEEQVALLEEGVSQWNAWREHHPGEQVDLSGANLSGADLVCANLSRANLVCADLSRALQLHFKTDQ